MQRGVSWYDILKEVDLMKETTNHKVFKIIAKQYNICKKTLINKYAKWVKDDRPENVNNESRGVKTYFSIEQERKKFI